MDTAISIGCDAFYPPSAKPVDPLVDLLHRYEDLIGQIESPDTDDDDVDRLMSEAMDIETIMLRVQPVSIEGYVATLRFASQTLFRKSRFVAFNKTTDTSVGFSVIRKPS